MRVRTDGHYLRFLVYQPGTICAGFLQEVDVKLDTVCVDVETGSELFE